MRLFSPRLTVVLMMLCGFSGSSLYAQNEAASFDIVGLRLGMTVEEAQAALTAYDPAMAVDIYRQHYVYSDGAGTPLKTDDFVAYIQGSRTVVDGNLWGSESFELYFTPTPENQRLAYIKRSQSNLPNPPTGQQYSDALIGKYGEPANQDSTSLRWQFPASKKNCTGSVGSYSPSRGNFNRLVFENGDPTRFIKRDVTDLSQCASLLEYQIGPSTSPAAYVTATMIDVAATAAGELRANAWVNELADNARKAREAKATKPKL